MKVIFLDHDGVICLSSEWGSRFKRRIEGKEEKKFDNFNLKAINILKEILEETGAEIVVSSDWKSHGIDAITYHYSKYGLKKPVGMTPLITGVEKETLESIRIREIYSYLSTYPGITKWVAIDDLEMFELGDDHFVHCPRSREGIKQTGIKEKMIKILNNK